LRRRGLITLSDTGSPHADSLSASAGLARRQSARRGWAVVAGAFVVMFVTFGVANSFSAFFASMERTFGASRGAVSLIYSIATPLYFLLGALSGPLADRIGPRRTCLLGLLIGGFGLAYAAAAESLPQVYFGFGVGVGVGVGFTYVPSIAAVQRWFVRRRAFASGIAVAGIGFGTFAMPLIVQGLIVLVGWRGAWLVMGIAMTLVGGAAAFFIDRGPDRRGLEPDGGVGTGEAESARGTSQGASIREAVTSRPFRLLYVALILISIGAFTPFVHLVPYAEDHGLSHGAAVLMLGLFGAGSIVGRFALGGFADRMGRRRSVIAVFGGMAIMQLWWLAAVAMWQIAIFAFVYGIFYGGYVALYPALTVDYFGSRNASGVIGILYTACCIGTFFGPLLAGAAFDAFESYALPIAVSAGFAGLAVVLIALAPEPGLSARAVT
jgi:MFS family permease